MPFALTRFHPQSQETSPLLKRTLSDSAWSLASPRALDDRSQSFGTNRSFAPDLKPLAERIAPIQGDCPSMTDWDVKSAWINSIWAVKPLQLRYLAFADKGDDPVELAFQRDQASQKWLGLLRNLFLRCHAANRVTIGHGLRQYQMGLAETEKKEIAHCYPSLIPLVVKTECDKICPQKLTDKMCEYFERLTFSAEGWIGIKNLSHNDHCLMLSWLLKIKICNLFRDLQEQIDSDLKKPDMDDLIKRHFRSIPDLNQGVYISDSGVTRGSGCCKLRAVLKRFSSVYLKSKTVRIEQMQSPINEYICYIYSGLLGA